MTNTDPALKTRPTDTTASGRQRPAAQLRSKGHLPRSGARFVKINFAVDLDFRQFRLDFWKLAEYPRSDRLFEAVEARWL